MNTNTTTAISHHPIHSILRSPSLWAPPVYLRTYERSQMVEIHAQKRGQVALCDTMCGFIIFGMNSYFADAAQHPNDNK